MQAFHEHPGDSPLIREVPLSHEEILELARRRNPFDDATTMYKKSVVEAVGGYDPKMARAQDYDLYARILAAGYETKNIPMVLCYFHEDAIALKRRLGARQLSCFIRVRWRVFRLGLGNFIDFLVPCLAQLVISAVPAKVAMKLYDKRLRADVSAVEARHEN